MTKNKDKAGAHANAGKMRPSKPTHFLCFPIASIETVPQISGSLNHWRKITTKAPRQPLMRRNVSQGAPESTQDPTESGARPTTDNFTPNSERLTTETLAEKLKVLPSVVTRAAGTYHLTLGVMNLEDEPQKQKALEILHGLNLQELLRAAEKGPPSGFKPARKWDDKKPADLEDTSEVTATDVGKSVSIESGKQSVDQDPSPAPLYIALTGLGAFPSLKSARVLWARPREQSSLSLPDARPVFGRSERLYNFGLHLIQPFREAGLITETRPLALHATVANMRFAKKSGGRGQKWQKGGRGFRADQVDARDVARVWNGFNGVVSRTTDVTFEDEWDGNQTDDGEAEQEDDDDEHGENEDHGAHSALADAGNEFVWIQDVEINRVAICKLGASKHEDPIWGEWYPAIEDGERVIFDH